MESKLKNDRKALGVLILHKIIQRRTCSRRFIWEAFESLSEDLGDDFMDFPDFEHFYLKLEKEECEMDYDGRPTYNRNLCDLPVDIIQMIAAKLTTDEKWILSETLPSLRKLMNPYLPGCKKLEIRINERYGSVTVEGTNYSQLEIDYYVVKSEESGELEIRRSVRSNKLENGEGTVEESMIRDIRRVLKNPRTRLVDLDIESTLSDGNSFLENLKPLLESQEDVQKVNISVSSPFHFHSILSGLKPTTLENIKLKSKEGNMDLSEILELDQMKQAKRVTLFCPNASYPLKNVLHFEEFDGKRNSWSSSDVLEIKNELIRNGNMKRFRVHLPRKIPAPQLSELLGPLNSEFNDRMEKRHFKIENSQEFIRIETSERTITFTREKEISEEYEW